MLDIRDYAMGEGSAAERQAFAAELAKSAGLREELQRYEFTLTALQSIPEEEIPRRIAFVSDPVFAPKWWQRFFAVPQWGFASAAVLGAAILGHGWMMRPVNPVGLVAQAPVVREAGISKEELKAVVAQAVAEAESRQRETLRVALSEAEKKHQEERQMMAVTFDENMMLMRKQMNRMLVSSANLNVGSIQQ
jgi:arsenate reductase-like glutaredoxin family protein